MSKLLRACKAPRDTNFCYIIYLEFKILYRRKRDIEGVKWTYLLFFEISIPLRIIKVVYTQNYTY